jgi:hypothetical protein
MRFDGNIPPIPAWTHDSTNPLRPGSCVQQLLAATWGRPPAQAFEIFQAFAQAELAPGKVQLHHIERRVSLVMLALFNEADCSAERLEAAVGGMREGQRSRARAADAVLDKAFRNAIDWAAALCDEEVPDAILERVKTEVLQRGFADREGLRAVNEAFEAERPS